MKKETKATGQKAKQKKSRSKIIQVPETWTRRLGHNKIPTPLSPAGKKQGKRKAIEP